MVLRGAGRPTGTVTVDLPGGRLTVTFDGVDLLARRPRGHRGPRRGGAVSLASTASRRTGADQVQINDADASNLPVCWFDVRVPLGHRIE